MARAALSLPFSGLSGSLGDTVIVQLPDGPQVRKRTPVRKGRTAAQDAARRRIEGVSRAWKEIDDAAFEAWGRYAEGQSWRNPATGAVVVPKAYCLFVGLASKARQVDPGISLAGFMPPERAFLGDGAIVEASGGAAAGDPGLPSPTLGGEASLRFSADRGNAPGTVTELLVQRLGHARRRAYRDKYASRGFVAFEGAGEVAVPVDPGAWACAMRFVRAGTGQETEIVELGVVVAG